MADYSAAFALAARAEHAYYVVQDWIQYDAPIVERELKAVSKCYALNFKTYLLIAAVIVLEMAVDTYDWLDYQLSNAEIHQLRFKLFKVRSQRRLVQGAIAIVGYAHYPKVERAYFRSVAAVKGFSLTKTLDTVFCLH